MIIQHSFATLPPPLRRRVLSLSLASFFTLAVFFFTASNPNSRTCYSCLPQWPLRPSQKTAITRLPTIPELDDLATQPPGKHADYCKKHFSPTYLDDSRNHSIQYCTADDNGIVPTSQLTCFHSHIRDDNIADSFCIGSGATWDPSARRFRLDCPTQRQPDANETADGLIPFDDLQPYWYDTGPKRIVEQFIALDGDTTAKTSDVGQPRSRHHGGDTATTRDEPSFILLIKREGASNLWHCLLEIWSMTMTMDVLRMALQDDGQPFYQTPRDLDNTHVVILDEHGTGPTLDLWRLFSRNPIVTLGEMTENPDRVPAPLQPSASAANTKLILPLPGRSNPLWHGDWSVRDCTPQDAPLVKLFVKRVFEHFRVPLLLGPKMGHDHDTMVVTFIDRRGTRQLLDHEQLLDALRRRHPHVLVQSVDFAAVPLVEQLRLVQDTDVLVGVHGAGLTHTMFMRAGAGAVVEIQPEGLGYEGFRNLAAMTGHTYFGATGSVVTQDGLGETRNDGDMSTHDAPERRVRREEARPWQLAHVRIEEDRFLALMDAAIQSVDNQGLRNEYTV